MTDHVRMMVEQGYYEGDPELIGHVFWASLHGLVVLHLADKLDGDFDQRAAARCAASSRRLSGQKSRLMVMRQVRPMPGSAARLA